MRQIVLDTETTGLEVEHGHRIIELACIELVNRRRTSRTYHQYLQPDREIDQGAMEVHGITPEMLADKPRFADIAGAWLEFVDGAELVIHNAAFDLGFLNQELRLCGQAPPRIEDRCSIMDTLALARRLHPGQRNSLDALCRRYSIDNSGREFHGALLDAELLAEVYLAMSGGQGALLLDEPLVRGSGAPESCRLIDRSGLTLLVQRASAEELAEHEAFLALLAAQAGGQVLWRDLEP